MFLGSAAIVKKWRKSLEFVVIVGEESDKGRAFGGRPVLSRVGILLGGSKLRPVSVSWIMLPSVSLTNLGLAIRRPNSKSAGIGPYVLGAPDNGGN